MSQSVARPLGRLPVSLLLAGIVGASSVSAFADSTTITVMGYRAGHFQESYITSVIEPFQKSHPDIKVKFYGIQNAAGSLGLMRAQKESPQVDAVIFDLSAAQIAKEEKLIAPLDVASVPNYADLKDTGRELGLWAPPLTYDTFTMIYNKAAFPVAPTSWKIMWDKQYSRKLILPAQGGGDIQAIAMTLIANKMAGGTDYTKTIAPGVDSLVKVAPNVLTWEPKPEQYTLVANGSAVLAAGWNARGQNYVNETKGAIGVTIPAEGTVMQVNVISMVANAKHQKATEEFINYALSPEAQKAFSESMYYAPTNSKTVISDQIKSRIPVLDADVQSRIIPVNWLEVAAHRDALLEPWRRQIIPASR